MFRKKRRWGWATLKALFLAQILYQCARFFLKAVIKQSRDANIDHLKKAKRRQKKS